jgi:hypothetical protein
MGAAVQRLGFAIAAVNIPHETIARCVYTIEEACDVDNVPYDIHVQETVSGPSIRCEARNRAIAALAKRCSVIVCVDVDCLVPPGLPAETLMKVTPGVAYLHYVRGISLKQWLGWANRERYLALPIWWGGMGGYLALATTDWLAVGGWDERCRGWGAEDVVMFRRILRSGIKVVISSKFPLLHVNHPQRDERTFRNSNLALSNKPQPNFLKQYLVEDK